MVQKNSINYNCIIIIGPTACGKTSLSIELAKTLESEIVSADSVQIYRGLDIGSAKVTNEEMSGIRHHMIDIIDADESYSVSQYKADATSDIEGIMSRGKMPIIVGGTGFYITALLNDNNYGDTPPNNEIRNKYAQILAEKGAAYIHQLLSLVDPESAATLHPNDTMRTIRALEIWESTGKTKSEWIKINKAKKYNSNLRPLIVGLNLSTRAKLYNKINRRVEVMFENGLVGEVEGLLRRGIAWEAQSMQAIGYKEFRPYIDGIINLEELKEVIALNSRHYAKRQLTYFNKFPQAFWYNTDQMTNKEIIKDILAKL